MFDFEHSKYLFLLLVVPLIIMVYMIYNHNRRKKISAIGDPDLVKKLMPDYSKVRKNLKFTLALTAIILLIIAVAGPRFGTKLSKVKREGFELIIALDVSNSMMAEDIKPNRLERAKQELTRLIDRLENDQIGLIVFAGDAFVQIPITDDFLSAKMFLSGINTNMVSRQGTDIGSAIRLATRSFSQQSTAGKAIVIISDGENHEGGIDEACKTAREKNIKIFTIGMGSSQGSRIPVSTNLYTRDFKRDKDGSFIISRLNEKMLADIADKGDGRYYRVNMPNLGLDNIIDQLNKLDKAETESKLYSEYDEQFPVFVWIVFALLCIDFMLTERKSRLLGNIRLFNKK